MLPRFLVVECRLPPFGITTCLFLALGQIIFMFMVSGKLNLAM